MKATSSATVFHVSNLEISILYYTTVLGFHHAFTFGDYAGICSGEATIHLCGQGNDGIKKSLGQGHICIDIDQIDSYYNSLLEKQVKIVYPIGDREYGLRDFAISDPDGNYLVFGQPISKAAH
ncbi:VOC family protein [Pedobacter sp. LMG 31464]|uniref:VOC family protein n=1 Tax=Pedobacter planticolens TaxID=2679964 RepID=A0A923IX00_9SPHI|nr:VOC family protein [Pedobacter planticolens]MBB2145767.1 VOC family protein [Pedobacter planticolens]